MNLTFLKSLALALSTFSRVPAPRAAWTEHNLRYLLAAFPLVGVLVGAPGAALLALVAANAVPWLPFSGYEFALILTLLPVLVTGGIHLDGFLDTADAIASRAPREKKLEILKDPHAGAFAVIAAGGYFLTYYVVSLRLFMRVSPLDFVSRAENVRAALPALAPVALTPVLSRLLSALAVVTFPCASAGLARTFADSAARRFTRVWCAAWICAVAAALVAAGGRAGACAAAAEFAVFFYYNVMSRREFGGITGDLAGWFVQAAELAALAAAAYLGGD